MLKRLFDVAAAGVGLLLLAPVIAVVAILIRSKSSAPPYSSAKPAQAFTANRLKW